MLFANTGITTNTGIVSDILVPNTRITRNTIIAHTLITSNVGVKGGTIIKSTTDRGVRLITGQMGKSRWSRWDF